MVKVKQPPVCLCLGGYCWRPCKQVKESENTLREGRKKKSLKCAACKECLIVRGGGLYCRKCRDFRYLK